MKALIKAVLVTTLITLTACALAPAREIPAQTGRVLDEETHQPIEDAIVVLRWQGVGTKAFVDTQTVCYHVESAMSDTYGRYTTMPWKEESRYRDLSMKEMLPTVYKAGYRQVREDRATGAQYLRKDMGSVKERLEYLQQLPGILSCGGDIGTSKLIDVVEGIYMEAIELCKQTCDRKVLNSIHYQHDVIKYGWEATQERKKRGGYK